ncbi:MAG: geranylgeranyl reductase family protein [Methylibium sp.]|uniref:NAD(P)/FAD-dependent oxidoreductase n=1 Tax=Methylibium sp. TaxID=2067992 RepID=UPI0018526321|nr:geranylgeranyl reductase family protein [Methylibium sp.]MBA3598011.1 geranylgeranyl reductase family protein [Methylibium sp.]
MRDDALLNRSASDLPAACDVLVVGAGPAGSAAACSLARAGFDVVLIDQHAFPRDKVCGDGLIPDAHRALQRLGVHDEVMALAQPVQHVRCIGPRGKHIDVPGTLAVLPRRQLDLLLARAAAQAGARMFAPLRFMAPIEDAQGTVIGARLRAAGEDNAPAQHEIRARWVLLASGAVPQALLAAGLCERRTPSAVALRGYVKNDAMVGRITELEVLWHQSIRPGYGWIFPCRDGVFNIGVGVAQSHSQGRGGAGTMQDVNLRDVFAAFTEAHPPARELMAGGTLQGELKGAPLRCSLEGARWSRPGLLATGEATGSTYALTGEGIGKALETGLLAADALIDGRRDGLDDAAVRERYESSIRALKPRFAIYEKANSVNQHPWLVDLLVWSANRSASRLKRMSGVLEETHAPRNLITAGSLLRLVFER